MLKVNDILSYEKLSPWIFFAGVLFSTLLLSWLGHFAARTYPFENFHRLSPIVSSGIYNPTALQLSGLVAKELNPGKIVVVVGGDSTFAGNGQREAEMWTECLKKDLGDDYRVLNLALAGTGPDGIGLYTAEMISARYPQWIYVSNSEAGSFSRGIFGQPVAVEKAFCDARARGMLLNWPPREAYVGTCVSSSNTDKIQRNECESILSEMVLNRIFAFDDLWHVIGYHLFFTVLAAQSNSIEGLLSRKTIQKRTWDNQGSEAFKAPTPFPDRFVEANMQYIRRHLPMAEDSDWREFDEKNEVFFPRPVRPHALVVVNRYNPHFLNLLSEAEKQSYGVLVTRTLERLRQRGFGEVMDIGEKYGEEDYIDGTHLSESGGRKLANNVAARLKVLSTRLGYTSNQAAKP